MWNQICNNDIWQMSLKVLNDVKEKHAALILIMCVHPLCLTDLHIDFYQYKYMLVICKTRELVMHNLSFFSANHN